jgi:hypothetical protein
LGADAADILADPSWGGEPFEDPRTDDAAMLEFDAPAPAASPPPAAEEASARIRAANDDRAPPDSDKFEEGEERNG